MKKCIICLAALICFAAYQLEAKTHRREPGFYLQGIGGFNFVDVPSDKNVSVNLETGYYLGASFGYKFSAPLRLEAEIAYRDNNYDSFMIDDLKIPLGGHFSTWTFMGNVLCDLPKVGIVVPYIGGGMGKKQSDGTIEHSDYVLDSQEKAVNIQLATYNFQEDGFIWQGIVGVGFELFKKGDFRVEYHYLDALDEENHALGLTLKCYF